MDGGRSPRATHVEDGEGIVGAIEAGALVFANIGIVETQTFVGGIEEGEGEAEVEDLREARRMRRWLERGERGERRRGIDVPRPGASNNHGGRPSAQ